MQMISYSEFDLVPTLAISGVNVFLNNKESQEGYTCTWKTKVAMTQSALQTLPVLLCSCVFDKEDFESMKLKECLVHLFLGWI